MICTKFSPSVYTGKLQRKLCTWVISSLQAIIDIKLSRTSLPLLRDHTHTHAHTCVMVLRYTDSHIHTDKKVSKSAACKEFFASQMKFLPSAPATIICSTQQHRLCRRLLLFLRFSHLTLFLVVVIFFFFRFAVVFAGPKRKTKIKHTHTHTWKQSEVAKAESNRTKFSLRNFFVFVSPLSFLVFGILFRSTLCAICIWGRVVVIVVFGAGFLAIHVCMLLFL